MKKIIYSIFGFALVLISGSFINTTLSPCDSPVVGDHSGAPGETNCSGCHSAPVNPNMPDIHFEVGNNDSTYIPGNTYLVHISIKRKGHNKFGFVCSSLDTLNTSKGTFNVINPTTTRKYTLGGRNYISHTPCGADSQDSMEWTYNWTAPATTKGKIKLYMSMLVANHDHALTGDTTYTRVISLFPITSNGINDLGKIQKTNVYPTLFTNEINLEFDNESENTDKEILLVNTFGEIIIRTSKCGSKFTLLTNHFLSKGMYFLKINYSNTSETFKIIKE